MTQWTASRPGQEAEKGPADPDGEGPGETGGALGIGLGKDRAGFSSGGKPLPTRAFAEAEGIGMGYACRRAHS